MAHSLTDRTLRGLTLTYAGAAGSAVTTLVVTAVLARLLTPSDFGVIALAGVALRFVQYFGQLGVSTALVKLETVNEDVVKAAGVVSVVSGVAAMLVMLLLAEPVSLVLLGSAAVAPYLRVLSVGLLLGSLAAPSQGLLRREMRFGFLSAVDVGSYVLGYGAMGVILAVRGLGPWSLVYASLAQGLVLLVGSYAGSPHALGWPRARSAFGPVASYGGGLSVVNFTQFLGYAVQPMIIGRVFGPAAVGLVTNSQRLSNTLLERLTAGLTKVIFPALTRVIDDRGRVASAFYVGYASIAVFIVPIGVCLSVLAGPAVLVVLGPQWVTAIPLVRVFALAGPMTFLAAFAANAADAAALLASRFKIELAYLVLVSAAAILASRWGLGTVAIVYGVAEGLYALVYMARMCARFGIGLRPVARLWAEIGELSVVMGVAVWACSSGAAAAGGVEWIQLVAAAAGAFVIVSVVLVFAWPRLPVSAIKAIGTRSTAAAQVVARIGMFSPRFASASPLEL